MKLLIDTNVVLDLLLKREPFYNDAIEAMNLARHSNIQEYVSASAITDIYYIAYRQIKDKKLVGELIEKLLKIVSIARIFLKISLRGRKDRKMEEHAILSERLEDQLKAVEWAKMEQKRLLKE